MNIRASRQNARQQATLDFMNKYNDSDKMTKGILAIRAIDTYIEKVENANSCEDTIKILITECIKERLHPNGAKAEERDGILFALNEFEILAVGLDPEIRIYDQKMVNDFLGHDVKEFYNSVKPIITYIREEEDDKQAFVKFQALAEEVKSGD